MPFELFTLVISQYPSICLSTPYIEIPPTAPTFTPQPAVGGVVSLLVAGCMMTVLIAICVIASVGFLVGRYKLKQRRIQHTASIQVCTYVHIICSR